MSRSSKHVSREKYENVKHKGAQWYNECTSLKEKIEKLTDMNKDLLSQNEDLVDQLKDFNDAPEQTHDAELVEELESENKTLKREIRNLKRDNKMIEDKYRDKIVLLERDLFVKDGKIQRLEDAKKDLKERYIELKEDLREERRSNRKEK
jgi:predicted RNase H-like nuclease (RuvC/YqgF family)